MDSVRERHKIERLTLIQEPRKAHEFANKEVWITQFNTLSDLSSLVYEVALDVEASIGDLGERRGCQILVERSDYLPTAASEVQPLVSFDVWS